MWHWQRRSAYKIRCKVFLAFTDLHLAGKLASDIGRMSDDLSAVTTHCLRLTFCLTLLITTASCRIQNPTVFP